MAARHAWHLRPQDSVAVSSQAGAAIAGHVLSTTAEQIAREEFAPVYRTVGVAEINPEVAVFGIVGLRRIEAGLDIRVVGLGTISVRCGESELSWW